MREKHVPVVVRTTVDRTGERTDPSVFCAREDRSIDARSCAGCMRMRSLEWDPTRGGEVVCLLSGKGPDPRADFAEKAARTHIGEILSPLATCVTPDVSLERVREALAADRTRAVLVVDAEGKLQGLVSRSDVAAAPTATSVAEVMAARVHALPDDAPVAYAISLMALEDVSEVPVVKTDGSAVGICYALDVLRWVATELGYALPKR